MRKHRLKTTKNVFPMTNGKQIELFDSKHQTTQNENYESVSLNVEELVERELIKYNIKYTEPAYILQSIMKANFVIPSYQIAISCYEDILETEYSEKTNKELEKFGWKVFRFSESNIRKNVTRCVLDVSDYMKTQDNELEYSDFTFIDLFSGIGGFRIPLEELGGRCLGYSEINKNSIETYDLNFYRYSQDEEIFLGDITRLGKLNLGNIDLVVGGVPCQAWSVAGKMKGFDDPRGKLWEDAVRVVELNQPKVFIFENVKGLFDPRNKSSLDLIIESLENVGYTVPPPQLLNSYDFGVPQNRDRIFIVGFRNDIQLEKDFTYPSSIGVKVKLQDILESVNPKPVSKKKLDVDALHSGKVPLSRNRFQKLDELNDFFIFCDTRNGHSTIHSWELTSTTKREREICMTILRNRRKKKYGPKDGNPLSIDVLREFIPNLEEEELENLLEKSILRKKDEGYEFFNSKNSSGINGIYRVYLPNSDIFSTLTATGTKDMIALDNVEGNTPEEFKLNFIKQIYKEKKYRPISSREAGKLQGFPDWFAVYPKEDIAKKQFGNAVSIPVIYYLVKQILNTGVLYGTGTSTSNHS